jgi:hypothetical protein
VARFRILATVQKLAIKVVVLSLLVRISSVIGSNPAVLDDRIAG